MRRRFVGWCFAALLVGTLPEQSVQAGATNAGLAFREVFELAQKELPGLSPAELEKLAAQGLLGQLRSHGLLSNDGEQDVATPCLATNRAFDEAYAYVRLARVGAGVAGEFRKALEELGGKEKLKGLVLDLRFANGRDYAAAAELADLFFGKAQTLFNVGEGTYRSHEKASAISLRCMVLINRQTAAAAEALAATLHEAGAGLILGNSSAGQARVWRSFMLSDGSRVWLAGDPVKLGSGKEISSSGVTPDIVVPLSQEVEQKFMADPFFEAERGAGARAPRRRVNEAALVRERGNGTHNGGEEPVAEPEAAQALLVRDPVLARALDLLKGLAVVRPGTS